MKLTKKQIALIIITLICTILFVMYACHIVSNLVIVISQIKNYPETREFYTIQTYGVVLGVTVPVLLYSSYLWLAISTFIQERNKIKARPPFLN